MRTSRFAIAGGGMVAGYAAKQMVESGLRPGELTIVSAEDTVPYERPPLSKAFLAGKETEDGIRISAPEFYREHGIEVLLETRVEAVDAGRKRLRLSQGDEIAFEKLIIATGSRVRTLDVPGSKLDGLFYLRSVRDAVRIRDRAAGAKRAVVVGGGFIGMEAASVLAQKQIETTMILREERVWQSFFAPEMSRFFESYYAARGVRFVKGTSIAELRGRGAVSEAALANGQAIACDMVVAGVGVVPATEALDNSGIEVSGGVVVNEYLETSRPDIWAAGDIANYPDVIFGRRRHVEHWDNAVSQGQHCARALMGDRAVFRHVPYFFSDVFDLSYEFWGDTAEAEQVVYRGDVASTSFSAWWLRGGTLVAGFAMNRPEEERTAIQQWIESRQQVSPEAIRGAGAG